MTSITLFHANWCGHCRNFMPAWKEIKKWGNKNGVTVEEYESEELGKLSSKNTSKVSDETVANISGFPTIIITKNGQEMPVNTRDATEIIKMLGNKPKNMVGGGVSEPTNTFYDPSVDYKQKYLKYKQKYLELAARKNK